MSIKNFVKKRKYLFWDVDDIDGLDEEAVVGAVLNYGDWKDVQGIIKILGIKKISSIFRKQTLRKRNNYSEKTKNYFKHYFNKHA